jgi:hypothetical protein
VTVRHALSSQLGASACLTSPLWNRQLSSNNWTNWAGWAAFPTAINPNQPNIAISLLISLNHFAPRRAAPAGAGENTLYDCLMLLELKSLAILRHYSMKLRQHHG